LDCQAQEPGRGAELSNRLVPGIAHAHEFPGGLLIAVRCR
jgi:hypothetical protein